MYVCAHGLPPFTSLPPLSIRPIIIFFGPSFCLTILTGTRQKGWCPPHLPFPCLFFLFLPLPSFLQQTPTTSLSLLYLCDVCLYVVWVVSLLFFFCFQPLRAPQTPSLFSICLYRVFLFLCPSFSYDHTLRTRSCSRSLTHQQNSKRKKTRQKYDRCKCWAGGL